LRAKRILLTGASGLLGRGIIDAVPDEWEIVGLQRRPDTSGSLARVTPLQADVTDADAMQRLIEQGQFDAIIHAAGEGSVDAVEKDPASGRRSIVEATETIALSADRAGAHMTYVSTNAVFSGVGGPFSEESETHPVNEYGRCKVDAEDICLRISPKTLIVRPILMYGWPSSSGRGNPVTMVIDALRAGRTVRMVNDVWENPLYNLHAGRAIVTAVAGAMSGVIHLAGATRVNRVDLAREVATVFELDAGLIEEVDSAAFPGIARRPPDTTFSSIRMVGDLDLPPLPLSDGLLQMRANEPLR
jgi:dTDP-4-dehydrorhamnose reductase